MKIPSIAAATLVLASALTTAAVADTDLWLHVRVEESGGANVRVNLPLSMVEQAIPLIPTEDGHIRIELDDDVDITVEEMRELWLEVKGAPDMTFVTVNDGDDDVLVRKEAGHLVVVTDGAREQVDVRIPLEVVDALFAGGEGQLDVAGAIRALGALGGGDLVTINDGSDRVRVWVDAIAEAE